MKLKDAFSRLRFTISKQHKPNEKDTEAFNFICDYFQKEEQQTIQDNLLFAKLYAYVLGKLSAHYNNVDLANNHLNKLLSQPFENTIHILLMELKAMEVRQVFADDMLTYRKPEEIKKTFERYPKFEKEFMSCWEYWDNDNVKAHLNSNINLSIKNFKNHV